MGHAAHQERYKEALANSRPARKRSRKGSTKKSSKGGNGKVGAEKLVNREHWSLISAQEITNALAHVITADVWPKYIKSFSSFQGWHDTVRRVYLGNEHQTKVKVADQELVVEALRRVTNQGQDGWEMVERLRTVQQAINAPSNDAVEKLHEFIAVRNTGPHDDLPEMQATKDFLHKINMSALFTKKNLSYIAKVNDKTFTVSVFARLVTMVGYRAFRSVLWEGKTVKQVCPKQPKMQSWLGSDEFRTCCEELDEMCLLKKKSR